MESYTNLKKLSDKNNEVEFRAEIPLETVQAHEARELRAMGQTVSLPGFRKGKVPEALLREHINPVHLLEETAETAVRAAIQDIVESEKLETIGMPKVTLQTLAPQKPILFTVRFAIEPNVKLPDYQAIGKEIFLRPSEPKVAEKDPTEEAGHTHDHANDVRAARRNEALTTIVRKATVTVPELLIEQELARYIDNRDAELERLGLSLDAFLKETKKTEKDLEKEDRAMIESRIRTSFVFRKIQETNNINASEREISAKVDALKHYYPNEHPQNLHRQAAAEVIEEKIFALIEPTA